MFENIYYGKKVLVTGHTGFKGSWLCAFLQHLGAELCGISLAPDQIPNHYSLLQYSFRSELCDICSYEQISKILQDFQPEIIFHLAAQPLVRESYKTPRKTFETNVLGSINILESCRYCKSVRAVVMVTSDKCYSNPENNHPFTEEAPLGGHDPYSASKAAAEIAIASYRSSFLAQEDRIALATARAGNVIGGGDWAIDRLIPDLVKKAASDQICTIRSPGAIRPWQHVLEALSGYLVLGQKLYSSGQKFASAWNFGPTEEKLFPVLDVIRFAKQEWEKIHYICEKTSNQYHEASFLTLDCSKAVKHLHWHPVWDTEEAIKRTIHWYRLFYEKGVVSTLEDLEDYLEEARQQNLEWIR